jgi:hypothetical protein
MGFIKLTPRTLSEVCVRLGAIVGYVRSLANPRWQRWCLDCACSEQVAHASDRKNGNESLDARARLQPGPFVLIEPRHFIDGQRGLRGQEGNHALVVDRLVGRIRRAVLI